MSIYLCAIQHILYSLEDDGIAAIVIPSGFLNKTLSLEKAIRKELISTHILRGVVSMPPNIFANTPTSVSVLFIDKSRKIEQNNENDDTDNNDKVILIDASHLGHTVKEGGNQRTVLSYEEEQQIINAFSNQTNIEDFSIAVPYDDIDNDEYPISPGQYFPVKVDYIPITEEEFIADIQKAKQEVQKFARVNTTFAEVIAKRLSSLTFVDIAADEPEQEQ